MSRITDFPVEILAKVFNEMGVEDAWAARSVCRYWRDVFELVAYGTTQSPLTSIKVGVEAVCGIISPMGDVVDKHVIHGNLKLNTNRKTSAVGNQRLANWMHEKEKYEYWPGGKWRNHEIGDALIDVKLSICGLPSTKSAVSLRLGPSIAMRGNVRRQDYNKEYSQIGGGKFKDFTLLVDTVEEPSYIGNVAIKHCINGLTAPKWQIYALLVHHAKTERELKERLHQHYVQSYRNSYSNAMTKAKSAEQRTRKICGGISGWMHLPPRWNLGTIEC
jgi:hypothetical protein